jgi:NADP-dependent 3-hydroxy acid dehydrogenase YdfG
MPSHPVKGGAVDRRRRCVALQRASGGLVEPASFTTCEHACMATRLLDQVILITGAAAGLGAELARQLAPHGAQLVLLDIDQERLTALGRELAGAGAEVESHQCDISDNVSVAAAFELIAGNHDHLDMLINNAGVFTDDVTEAHDPSRRREAFLTNALGPIQVTNAALPLLRRSTGVAHVVNVISASGFSDTQANDNRRWSTYGATKSALAGFNTTLTAQLAPEGIKVSGIFPGGFESDLYESAGSSEEQHDAPWMMRTRDIAEIVVFAMTRPPDVQIERLLVTKRFEPATDT